jgi:Na+/melibiose symporter-like transporter
MNYLAIRSMVGTSRDTRIASSITPSVYASAHFAKSLFWYSSEALFAFLMTERANLTGMQAGLILAAGLFISAGLDIVVGSNLNRRVSTVITAGRMQFGGSIVTAVAMALLFAMPGTALAGSVGLALIAGVSFRLAYAFVDIPQNVLLAIGGASDQSRTQLASWRLAASGLASLTIALIGSMVVFNKHTLMTPFIFALVIGGVAILLCGLLYLNATRFSENVANMMPTSTPERSESWLASGRVRLFLCCVFLSSLCAPVFTKLLPYFAFFQMREPILGASLMIAVSVGMVIGQFVWIRILPFRNWADRLMIAGLAVGGSAALFGVSGAMAAPLLPVFALVFGIGSGGLGSALWSGYATVVSELCPGREAVAFGAFTAVSKISNAMGVLGLGVLLSDTSFRTAGNIRLLVTMMCSPLIAGLMISAVALIGGSVWRGAPSISWLKKTRSE